MNCFNGNNFKVTNNIHYRSIYGTACETIPPNSALAAFGRF